MHGKDQAIKALGLNLLEKGREHEEISEKFNIFKNKLIAENCFHTVFAARKVEKTALLQTKVQEVTLSFMRDKTFEEEFFFVVEHKEFNAQSGCRDKLLIAVDDIQEMVHTQDL